MNFLRITISWQSLQWYRDIVTIAASTHDASSVLSHVSQHETPGWVGWPHRTHRHSQINQQRIQTVV